MKGTPYTLERFDRDADSKWETGAPTAPLCQIDDQELTDLRATVEALDVLQRNTAPALRVLAGLINWHRERAEPDKAVRQLADLVREADRIMAALIAAKATR